MHHRARLIRGKRPFDTNCQIPMRRSVRGPMCDNTRRIREASRLHNRESNNLSLSVRSRRAPVKSRAVSRCVNDSPTCITEPGKTIINYLICPVGLGLFLIVKRRSPSLRPSAGSFFRLAVPRRRRVDSASLLRVVLSLSLCVRLFLIAFLSGRFILNKLRSPRRAVVDPGEIMHSPRDRPIRP